MPLASVTSPAPAPARAVIPEPTHRYGRPLDDRIPASGMRYSDAAADVSEVKTAALSADAATADGDDGAHDLSFDDFLDIINPLQHLPVVSSIYRHFTDDEISAPAKVAGGALFGGILGLAGSLLDVAIEEMSGDDVGGHIMTALFPGEGDSSDSDTLLADGSKTGSEETDEAVQLAVASSKTAAAGAPVLRPASVPSERPPAERSASVRPLPAQASQSAPPIPNLSPAAFDALMESFTTGSNAAPGGSKDNERQDASPGFAYLRQPGIGSQVDHAL